METQSWCLVLTYRGGMGREVGGECKRGTYVYLGLIHVDV